MTLWYSNNILPIEIQQEFYLDTSNGTTLLRSDANEDDWNVSSGRRDYNFINHKITQSWQFSYLPTPHGQWNTHRSQCQSISFQDNMMTSSNGNIFRVTGHLCGNSLVTGEFPAQRPVTRSVDIFYDLRPNKRLSKQSWGWWFETLSRPLWCHCNEIAENHI